MGAYWLWPAFMAAMAASMTKAGPSKSGKPWPRLMASCWRARAVISAKTEVPKGARRWVRGGRMGGEFSSGGEQGRGEGRGQGWGAGGGFEGCPGAARAPWVLRVRSAT